MQMCTAAFLVLIAATHAAGLAVCLYLLYFAAQFMCGPGIYNLLMNSVPAEERSTASAMQNLSGALCQAGAAAVTGACIVKIGYRDVLLANAVVAGVASILFLRLSSRAQGAVCGESNPHLGVGSIHSAPLHPELQAGQGVR